MTQGTRPPPQDLTPEIVRGVLSDTASDVRVVAKRHGVSTGIVDYIGVHGNGAALFREVEECYTSHFWFAETWHAKVHALFTLQAKVAPILPGVFNVGLAGDMGTAKSKQLKLGAKLTGGLLFENISVPALARSLKNGIAVFLDEKDSGDKEVEAVKDALLRSGYQADAPPYVRWDVRAKAREEIPVYGPRMFAFRGTLDEALQSRTYEIPGVKYRGDKESGYRLVVRNLWQSVGDLPQRLETWGSLMQSVWKRAALEAVAETPSFVARVRQAARDRFGASRSTELATVALFVAEIAGVDLAAELAAASEATETATTDSDEADLNVIREAIAQVLGTSDAVKTVTAEREELRVRQAAVKSATDRILSERRSRPFSASRFALLRRRLLDDTRLVRYGNAVVWCLSPAEVATMATIPTMTHMEDSSHGSHGSQGLVDSEGQPHRESARLQAALRRAHDIRASSRGMPPGLLVAQVVDELRARNQDLTPVERQELRRRLDTILDPDILSRLSADAFARIAKDPGLSTSEVGGDLMACHGLPASCASTITMLVSAVRDEALGRLEGGSP